MKSPFGIVVPMSVGFILGCLVAALMGVRDSVFDSLSHYDPKFAVIEHRLSASYKKLGNAYLPFDAEAARDAFLNAARIDEPLADASPNDPVAQVHLAYSCGRLGALAMSLGDYSEAESQFDRGVRALEELAQVKNINDLPYPWPLTPEAPALSAEEKAAGPALVKHWLNVQRRNVAICREAEYAIADLSFALAQPEDHVAELLFIRGRALAKRGLAEEAVATAERLAALDAAEGKQLFDAARIYTLAATNAVSDETRGVHLDEAGVGRERYLAKAVELLTQAADNHFFDDPENRTSLKVHRDLVPLYGRDDFKQLLANVSSP
jgi:tetratricopeptide (TPR) repeat protein